MSVKIEIILMEIKRLSTLVKPPQCQIVKPSFTTMSQLKRRLLL